MLWRSAFYLGNRHTDIVSEDCIIEIIKSKAHYNAHLIDELRDGCQLLLLVSFTAASYKCVKAAINGVLYDTML